ncbi:hypothetical protein, partial [Luteimonas sp. MHLX1A]|uniref:hypothetical protein n=1 Tax=Alterluteimonas muca TaxID=2878684 RepID=UPI001E5841E9
KPARTGRKRPKSDLKSMKIAARHNIDARVAAKAASGRVIQMILRPLYGDLCVYKVCDSGSGWYVLVFGGSTTRDL